MLGVSVCGRKAGYSWLTCDEGGEERKLVLRFFSMEGHFQVHFISFIHHLLIKHIRANHWVLELQVVASCLSMNWDPVRLQLFGLLASVPVCHPSLFLVWGSGLLSLGASQETLCV